MSKLGVKWYLEVSKMNYTTMILAAAKAAKVSGAILLAICTHESGLKNVISPMDHGSPSYGLCQVKESSARMIGFKGPVEDLMRPEVNVKWAALYLKWQMKRYGNNGCKLTASFNAGSYLESTKNPGKPRNLKYVKMVQEKLDDGLKYLLSCETRDIAMVKFAY